MNKFNKCLIILYFIFLLFNTNLNSAAFRKVVPLEPFFFGELEATISNFFNKNIVQTSVKFRYNQDIDEKKRIKEKIEIYFNDYIYRTCVTFNFKDISKLLKMIDTYFISVDKEKKEKDIGQLDVNIAWKIGEDQWIETFNSKMFIKIVTSIDKSFNMSISFSEGVVSTNEKHTPGILFLKEEIIKEFKRILSDENLSEAFKNAKEIK